MVISLGILHKDTLIPQSDDIRICTRIRAFSVFHDVFTHGLSGSTFLSSLRFIVLRGRPTTSHISR